MKNNIVYKYSSPTQFDHHSFGTLWYNMGKEDSVGRYIQVSENESTPHWEILGSFLEKALVSNIQDDKFLNMCLKSYKQSINDQANS